MIAASTLPDNGGYVAAAYLVFLVLLLVYLAIMAARLGRIERELVELNAPPASPAGPDRDAAAADEVDPAAEAEAVR